jgi:hypothetical protein
MGAEAEVVVVKEKEKKEAVSSASRTPGRTLAASDQRLLKLQKPNVADSHQFNFEINSMCIYV